MQAETEIAVNTDGSLKGYRVAVARSAEETNTAANSLSRLGAELVYYPCLDVLPAENLSEFDEQIKKLDSGDYDWLILSTASGVMVLAQRLEHLGKETGPLQNVQIALFGANTRKAAHDLLNIEVDSLPEFDSHAELVQSLEMKPGSKVLLPVPKGYQADWSRLLEAHDAEVTVIAAYRAFMGHGGDELPAMLWSGEVDAIVFNSENNVRYFAKRLRYEGGTLAMLDDVCVACIEPQTANVAQSLGLRVHVVPQEHTTQSLAAELAAFLAYTES